MKKITNIQNNQRITYPFKFIINNEIYESEDMI